jgi:hypothetical protein
MPRRSIVFPGLVDPRSNRTALNIGQIRLREDDDNGTDWVGFKASKSISEDVVWTLPDTFGGSGEVLGTDGDGNLSWSAGSGGLAARIATLQADMTALDTLINVNTQWIYGTGLLFNDGTNWITWTTPSQSIHNAFTWNGSTFSPPVDGWYRFQGGIQTRQGASERAVWCNLRDDLGVIPVPGEIARGQCFSIEGGDEYYYMNIDIACYLEVARSYHLECESRNGDSVVPISLGSCFIITRGIVSLNN